MEVLAQSVVYVVSWASISLPMQLSISPGSFGEIGRAPVQLESRSDRKLQYY